MRARVDAAICQGHARCHAFAPEWFLVDDHDGHAAAQPGEVPVELEARVRAAAESCPERAITILAG